MFGWEFPPHISGGLGTACAGLTRALEKEHVHVLFVVPKLRGGEIAERTEFISASAVPILQAKHSAPVPRNLSDVSLSDKPQQPQKRYTVRTEGDETIIEVPSLLDPYTIHPGKEGATGLKQWNYSFDKKSYETGSNDIFLTHSDMQQNPSSPLAVKEPFLFSGGYGANLMEEVARYADVAREIARTNSFDVIHAHDWMTYPAGIAASQVSGKPLVLHVHATEIDRSGAHVHPVVYEIEKNGMHLADKVVAVSNWTKRIAVQRYGIDENKIEVVHNGITPRTDAPVSHYPAPPVGSRIVTFLGRITHQKGPMYFVEAARKVHEKFPDVHFVVAGSGDMLPDMIERIAQLRLSKHFHFTGFLNKVDIDRIWSVSNVYVMPSVSEPFGIAPLEAIQAGVPVILSKQAGVSEVMPHAMKVDFWNSLALAEAICDVLRFKSLANTLRKNGAEELKNITWNKAAKKLIELYYDLTSKHEKPEKYPVILPDPPAITTKQAAVL